MPKHPKQSKDITKHTLIHHNTTSSNKLPEFNPFEFGRSLFLISTPKFLDKYKKEMENKYV